MKKIKTNSLILIFSVIIYFFIANQASAFIPPDVLGQALSVSLSSITTIAIYVFSGIISISIFLMAFFKEKRKLILLLGILLIENIILGFTLFGFFQLKYYKPLYIKFERLLDFSLSPEKEITENLSDNPQISSYLIEKYGASYETLKNSGKKLYFVDVREEEEFDFKRIKDALNLRGPDITVDLLKSKLSLSDKDFNDGIIVLYCHDGTRSSWVAEKLNFSNIKFLIDPYEVIDDNGEKLVQLVSEKKFKDEDAENIVESFNSGKYSDDAQFYLTPEKMKRLSEINEGIILNGTVSNERIGNLSQEPFKMVIPYMTSAEYDNAIKQILKYKNKNVVVVINDKSEFYFARILFKRLEEKYGFKFDKFRIVSLLDWQDFNNIK